MTTQTPADAATLANDHVAAIKRQIDIFTHAPRDLAWMPVIQHRMAVARRVISRSVAASSYFGHGDTGQAAAIGQLTDDEMEELQRWDSHTALGLQFTAQDAGVIKLWERFKIAYTVDPDLWAELGDAGDDTTIPPGLLAKLPHPDPFITLPEPILIPTFDRPGVDVFQRVEGFFVTGRFPVGTGYLPTSTGQTSGALSLLICSRIVRADGSHYHNPEGLPDYSWTRIGVDEGRSVGQMVAATRETFKVAARGIDWEREVVLSLRRCVAVLLYLCATNADLQALPRPARKRVKGGKRRADGQPVQVVKVGYRLGASLRAYRAREATAVRGEPTGKRVRPHVRRAHPHFYRVGPGRPNERTQVELKWISAIPINFSDDAEVTTVHHVPKKEE